MKFSLTFWLLAAASALAEEPIPRAPLVIENDGNASPGEAVSRSMQFRVNGGDGSARGTVAILAEQTKDELIKLLTGGRRTAKGPLEELRSPEEKDEWKVPIRINLVGKKGDPVPPRTIAMELFFNETGYDLRIKAHLANGLDTERMASAITSALIYERSLRTRKPGEAETELNVPAWLVDGLREATAWDLGQSNRKNYETLFKRGGLYQMDQLFAVTDATRNDLDAASKLAFQVSCGALVMALIEQPQGRDGFREFLSEVAGYQGEMPVLLRKHFPELNLSETSLAKWWALQLANRGSALMTDTLSIGETDTSLGEVLKLYFRSADGVPQERSIDAWQEISELKLLEKLEAVQPAQEGLVRLSNRSFPSYRPVLLEYQAVLTNIGNGKTASVPEQLASANRTRELMRGKAEQGRDFLDWFEITRAQEESREFDDYARLKDQLEIRPNRRIDPMSKYLDQMDDLFKDGQSGKKTASPQLLLPP